MRSSPAERFARRLALAIEAIVGADGWTLRLTEEGDWASATLEGFRAALDLAFADGGAPSGLAEKLEALDLDMPTHFLGDLLARPVEGGLSIKALLLKAG